MKRLIHPLLAATLLFFVALPAYASSKEEIDAEVNEAKAELFKLSSAAKDLSAKAVGILWFPKVTKGGIGIGGEFGEGVLQVGGKTVGTTTPPLDRSGSSSASSRRARRSFS